MGLARCAIDVLLHCISPWCAPVRAFHASISCNLLDSVKSPPRHAHAPASLRSRLMFACLHQYTAELGGICPTRRQRRCGNPHLMNS
ncbi:unnamed protein product [Ciceribacter sp. T2.26MG-112.2]|nr:unnamed protein product [Ciceribacter naphthalenivorans]